MQMPFDFLTPQAEWKLPNLDELPQDWNATKRIGFDTETKDPLLDKLGPGMRRPGFRTAGFTVSLEDGPSFYLPIGHAGGDNLPREPVLAYMRRCMASYRGMVVGAKLDYDLDVASSEGLEFHSDVVYRDVQVVDALIDEHQLQYGLEAVGQRRIGAGKEEDILRKAAEAYLPKGKLTNTMVKKLIADLPARFVGTYAEFDGIRPLQILRAQDKIVADQDLGQVSELEGQVLPVLVRMRRRGIRVNERKLDEIEIWARAQEAASLEEVFRETGVRIEVGDTMKADIVAKALMMIGVTLPVTSKGSPSITKLLLESITHPVAGHIRRARKMSQLQTTFVSSVRTHLVNGRIHCTFNQTKGESAGEDGDLVGVGPGRLSCQDPNLQQQPKRDDEIGALWRSIYIPEEGCEFQDVDFASQEPRWLVHWAVCAGVSRIGRDAHNAALEFAKLYNDDPDLKFHKITAAIASVKYDDAKILGLARIYGRGGPSTCRALNLPTATKIVTRFGQDKEIEIAGPAGQLIMDKFDAKVPFARKMMEADSKQAEEIGYIRTWSKRRCRFVVDTWGNIRDTHKGLNNRIQGSSGDQAKKAMVEADRAGHFLQVQVHDELLKSDADPRRGQELVEIMEQTIKLKVPVRAELSVGSSWGEVVKV